MSGAIWWPGLLVLAAGLAAGLAYGWRLRRRAEGTASADRDLARRDLERRRDELYGRLDRAAADGLSDAERERLEEAAARVLRDLDQLGPAPARGGVATAGAGAPARPDPAAGPPAWSVRHPLLVGFVFGAGVVVLVGLLVYWAARDPGRPAGMTAGGSSPRPESDEPHDEGAELPPEVRAELDRLAAAVDADPSDLLSLKKLALLRLEAGLFFQAFADAEKILAGRPADPDGLFIQGVVRLTMGRSEDAVELLGRVLEQYPDHLQALSYRGLALAQLGAMSEAIASWERGVEVAGGRHPELERLIEMARAEPGPAPTGPFAAAGEPPPGSASPPGGASPPPPPPAPQMPVEGASYALTIGVLDPGAVPRGAVLFVSLRPAAGGPPVAVKRIGAPEFPIEVVLDQRDSMMGSPLPDSGTLSVRLDRDGSASTRDPGDLEASAEARAGQTTSLVLE